MSNIKVQINGFNYDVPVSCLTEFNGKKRICISAKVGASMLRQYIKTKYPKITNWVNSSVYAGGSSIRIYICQKDGSPVEKSIVEDLEKLSNSFQAGWFDGMTDSYIYTDLTISDYGTEVCFYANYVFVVNRPRSGTIESIIHDAKIYKISVEEYIKQSVWITENDKISYIEKYNKIKK